MYAIRNPKAVITPKDIAAPLDRPTLIIQLASHPKDAKNPIYDHIFTEFEYLSNKKSSVILRPVQIILAIVSAKSRQLPKIASRY